MSAPAAIAIVTRKSILALAQAEIIAARLQREKISVTIKKISTTGDEITSQPLADIGGKELFIGNLRRALKNNGADIAVHSLKDMAAKPTDDFTLIAAGFAEDARDVFISTRYLSLEQMPSNATVGTCSPRRAALLKKYFPQIIVVPMRGNIHTRLQKLQDGECDAIILAAAGLRRLQLIHNHSSFQFNHSTFNINFLSVNIFIPAPGQGLLAIECLSEKYPAPLMRRIAKILQDDIGRCRGIAEREVARIIGGDCHTPLGAHAQIDNDIIYLTAFYEDSNGYRTVQVTEKRANETSARAAGAKAANLLLTP